MLAGAAGFALGALTGAGRSPSGEPNRHTELAQMNGKPRRRYYHTARKAPAFMPIRHGSMLLKNPSTWWRLSCFFSTAFPRSSTPWT